MKIRNKISALVLTMCMVITSVSPTYAFSNLRTETTEILGDYYKQYVVTLFNDKELKVDKDIALSVDDASRSLIISGKNETLLNAKIGIKKQFDFSGNPVGRFSIDASAENGQTVTIGFYLDNSDTPFFATELVKQEEKGTWTFSKDISKDVMAQGITGKHHVSFAILSSSEAKETRISIKSFEFAESSVPVVYLDINETQGTIDDMNSDSKHATECHGDMTIKVPEDFTSEYTGESIEGGTYAMEYIRGRGNSTWNEPKKPYKIKLDKKADLLGMGKNKHWVLLANALDDGMLRNKITYWLGAQLGMPFTPQSEPVDVVMNGEYLGSYMLTEHVRVGNSRVDIDDLEGSDYTEEPEITGGYLLSRNPKHSESDQQVFKTARKLPFLIESPEFKGNFNEVQYNYIKNYVQTVEDTLFAENFKIGDQSYQDLMDMTSAVLYYWVQEFSMNWDGYGSSSTFLYKPRNDKLYWGPLWDFDFSAWGATEYTSPHVKGWKHNAGSYTSWNRRMFEDPEFVTAVKAAWPQIKALVEELIKKDGQLDWYADRLNISARYNYEKWEFNSAEELESTSFDNEIERLRDWISGRLQWIDINLDTVGPEKTTVTFLDKDGNVVDKYEAYIGGELKIPAAPKVSGYVFEGWEYDYDIAPDEYAQEMGYDTFEELKEDYKNYYEPDEIEEAIADILAGLKGTEIIYDEGEVIKDMVLTAKYRRKSEIIQVDNIYFGKNKYYGINYTDFADAFEVSTTVTPFDATFQDIKLSSSNENVVEVNPYGWAVVNGAGDAVITATTRNGISRSVNVHIYSEKEYEDLGYPTIESGKVENSKSMKVGEYAQLKVAYSGNEGICSTTPEFTCLNEDIVELGNNGVIRAIKEGTATVLCHSDVGTSTCTITVTNNSNSGIDDNHPGIDEDVPQCEGYSVAKLENPGKTTWVDVNKDGKSMMVGFEYDNEIRSLHEDSYIAIKRINKMEDPCEWMEYSSLIDVGTTIEGTPILLDIKFVDRSGHTQEAILEDEAKFYIQLGDAFEIEDVKACYLRLGTDELLNTNFQSVVSPKGPIECLCAEVKYIYNKMMVAEVSTNSKTLPKKTTNKAVAKKGKIKVSWNPIYGVDGYQIGYRRIGKKTWKYSVVKKASTKTKTLTKLKKGKKYTVKVRPYIKTSKNKKIYGKWLNGVKAKSK